MSNTKINLSEQMFSEAGIEFLANSNFKVTLFRYRTGVCAARLENSLGHLVVLPFQGQQIWRMNFNGRDLTMRSIFDEPEKTTRFGLNYGGFLIHCGLTANGNPSVSDTHPLHGELPNCAYQGAYIAVGSDQGREYLALGGCYTYRNSLEFHYTFEPELRLYADSSIVEMNVKASNLRSKPMKYMYMAHINWLPVDGSRLVYSADHQSIEVFNDTFGLPTHEQQAFSRYVVSLVRDPSIADRIDSSTQVYDPELCMYIRYKADEDGYAHAMQVLPGGEACFVSFRALELPNAVRWIARTGDEDAIGFAIPATNNHMGYTYNLERGLIREIPARGCVEMSYRFGCLDKRSAAELETRINVLLGKG